MSRLTNKIQVHATRSQVVTVKARGDRQMSRLIKQYTKRGYTLQATTRGTLGANHLTFIKDAA